MSIAKGTFEVELTPACKDETPDDTSILRMDLLKHFRGDLVATSKGEMLSAGTIVKGSAGYVALERVTGTLNGCTGSFVLQHTGTLHRGTAHLKIDVVPDSGTGELIGLTGHMTVDIADGKQSYEFEFTRGVLEFG